MENNNKRKLPKDSLQCFLSFLTFASLVVVKTTLLLQLPQAWALFFDRPFLSKCLLAFAQVSIHHGLILNTFKENSSDKYSGETDGFQAFHILTGQAKNRETDVEEYLMSLYSVENHKYSTVIVIQSVLQLTAKKVPQNYFCFHFYVFRRPL